MELFFMKFFLKIGLAQKKFDWPKKNVVVPHGWVRGIAGYIESLINDGVNRHRRYLVFYTNNPAAFADPGTNQMPRENFAPDLNASHSSSYPGPYLSIQR